MDLRDADQAPPFSPPNPPGATDVCVDTTATCYEQTEGFVYDSQPRVASNLIVDLTTGNPAAVEVAAQKAEVGATTAGDGRIFIPNEAPDEGLSAPFNAWMTFFGQFFDHGLDLVNKGGSGTVVTPLLPDDPLYNPASQTNFLMLTRNTNQPGPDGIVGDDPSTPGVDESLDDVHEHVNQTTPFIDQNQTYTSHPSHQVFLREYEAGPIATGRLLDGATGGLATWNDVKAQAQSLLGITLDDYDIVNVPEVVTDPYGNFVGELPQLTGQGTGHAFLDDIAHTAVPFTSTGAMKAPGTPAQVAGNPNAFYDFALLGDHFITGDGRGNENIGLTAVHHVFHAEHNRLWQQVQDVLNDPDNAALKVRFETEGGPERWSTGERLFQAAKFVTEMEYQHGVFEEFGRTIQPFIDVLPANESGYHTTINAAVSAEFAHVVYRFGHSMLTETLPCQGFGTSDMTLLEGFLNPREFLDDGNGNPLTPEQAAGSIAMGMVNHAGSGIDEFVTETLRNELLGLPLDLATINMMRGRDAGVPSFQAARAKFFAVTGDSDLKPFESWQDFGFSMKHPESLVNFIAAYGTHPSITDATTNADKRLAAEALMGTGFLTAPAAETGLNDVDFWIGGLAESIIPFGGMLGATFNFVFESQMESVQNGDRFDYLSRNIGLNLLHQLEANSFSGMIMRTTDATNIPADIFQTPTDVFDLNGPTDLVQETHFDMAATARPGWNTGHRFVGGDHITIHGTPNNDMFRGGLGDDSLWGFEGDDYIVGGVGGNSIVGGEGDDVLFGMGGDDNIKGGKGNDAIHAGSGDDLILGGSGKDFIFHGSEFTTTFAGLGDDFVLGSNGTSGGFLTGNEGDDWLEGQGGSQLLSGDNSNGFQNDPNGGHDVMLGGPGNDDHDSEGGDDVMVASEGSDRFEGMFGFDWVTYRGVDIPAVADMENLVFQPPDMLNFRSRFDLVEGLSGWDDDDVLRGYDRRDAPVGAVGGGHELTEEQLNRVLNLRTLLGGPTAPHAAPFMTENPDSNILLGGAGSDIIEGRGGNNFIDGSAWMNVQLEHNGARHDSMNDLLTDVFNGVINPGAIEIVREIVLDADAPDTINIAVFRDVRENYEITEYTDGTTTVAHNGDFGTDRLRNIQRLQFGPGDEPEVVVLPLEDPPVNSPATGQPVILGDVVENVELTVDTSAIADADGIVGDFTFEWQVQDVPDGEWVPPTSGNAGGATFTPAFSEVDQNVRVIVSFNDGFVPSVTESVTSNPVGPVVTCEPAVGCGPPVDDPPAIPTGLTATGGEAQISLGWFANTDADLAGYRLYRSETTPVDVGTADLVASPAEGDTTFVDTTVTPGTTYFYVLVAVDDGGNPSLASDEVSAVATTPLVRFEQNDPNVVLSAGWTTAVAANRSGGSAVQTNAAGRTVSATFTGSTLRVIAGMSSSRGIMTVAINGGTPVEVDTYAPSTLYQAVVFEQTGLGAGEHTVEIVSTGTKRPAALGTWVEVEAIEADGLVAPVLLTRFEQNDPNVVVSAGWTTAVAANRSGGSAVQTNAAGRTVSATFTGSTLRVIAGMSSSRGIMTVAIDGGTPVEVDTYAPSTLYQAVVFEQTGLGAGEHTVEIVSTGTKRPAALGTWVEVDAIEVDGLVAP